MIKIQKGFTLVEIMVVIVIIAIAASMVAFSSGTSTTRKNRGYYERFIASLKYVRLASAESMQPMGIHVASSQPLATIQLVKLANPYATYQNNQSADAVKSSMELSGMDDDRQTKTPQWVDDKNISLPEMPDNVSVHVTAEQIQTEQKLQPWFNGQQVPQIMWFGTGQAAPVAIEIKFKDQTIGEVIHLLSDGSIKVGNEVE